MEMFGLILGGMTTIALLYWLLSRASAVKRIAGGVVSSAGTIENTFQYGGPNAA